MLRGFALVWLFLAPAVALAEAGGVDSRVEFGQIGCGSTVTGEEVGCHFQDANSELMVSIDGPPQVDLAPQGFGIFFASIPVGSFEREGAGINVAIDEPNATSCVLEGFPGDDYGPLALRNDGLSQGPVLSHVHDGDPPPLPTLANVWAYRFLLLECETPGELLLRVAMNAFDGDGTEDGEIWNSTTLAVTVPEPGVTLLGVGALAGLALRGRRRS